MANLPPLTIGEVQKQINEVNRLTQAFEKLSAADQINPEIGGKLQSDIQAITTVLDRFKEGIRTIPEITIKGIAERTAQLEKLEAAGRQLNTLDPKEIEVAKGALQEIDRLKSEINGLKVDISSVPELKVDFNNFDQDILKAKEKLKGLSTSVEINADLGSLQAALSKIQGITLPKLSFGEIEIQTAALSKLKQDLADMPELDKINPEIGGKALAEVMALEKELTDLSAAIKNPPDLVIQGITEQTNKIKKLQDEYDKLSLEDQQNINIGGTYLADIQKLKDGVNQVKKDMSAIPGLDINLETFDKDIIQAKERLKGLNTKVQIDADLGTLQAALSKIKNITLPKLTFGEVEVQTSAISKLRQDLESLPEIDKINPEIGGKALLEIEKLSQELLDLQDAIRNTPDLVIQGIEQRRKEIEKLEEGLNNLSSVDQQEITINAGNITRLKDEIAVLKKDLVSFPDLTIGHIVETLGQISAIKANVISIPDLVIDVQGIGEL
jgi:hypothetical protein